MKKIIEISTDARQGLYDITADIAGILTSSGLRSGVVSIWVRGATAAIMIQENWDQSVQTDVINLLTRLIPAGIWEHDRQDNNGDSHLKAGIIGPSEVIPFENGKMLLSTWQNIFLCEFDGPRSRREVVITIIADGSDGS